MQAFRAEPPPWKAVLVSTAVLAVVVWLDCTLVPDLSLSPLYAIPVAITTWWGGRRWGVFMGFLASIAWVFATLDSELYREITMVYCDGVLRMAFYVAAAYVLMELKRAGLMLQATVEARTAALQSLAAELSAAEDAQRRQAAYDIHDALSQNLSLLKLRLESLHQHAAMPAAVPSDADGGWGSSLKREICAVDELIQQTRTLTFDLYPPTLDDLGMAPAIREFADQMRERDGVEVVVHEEGTHLPLPTPLAHFLFRAIKELVGNAARHGKASQAIVLLHWRDAELRAVVDDDGGGFDPAAPAAMPGASARRRGLGLVSIRQRITALGGTFQLESKVGEGTRAILEVPVGPGAAAAAPPPGSQ
jgi:signal transduction histidine kinase